MDQPPSEAQVFAKIQALTPRGLIGRLRPLFPVIDRQIRAGVPRAEIVSTLQSLGFAVTLKYLENALYRWRRRDALARYPPSAVARALPLPVTTAATPTCSSALGALPAGGLSDGITSPPISSPPIPSPAMRNKGDLARLRKTRSPDLNALAQLGKQATSGRNS